MKVHTSALWMALCLLVGACSNDTSSKLVGAADASLTDGGLCTSCGACEERLSITGATHVEHEVEYADPPPASGDHHPCWTEWKVHSEAVDDERWVHNLEHGGVVYLHHCRNAACEEQVNAIAEFVEGRDRALSTPYPDLKTQFAIVAWGHRLVTDCYDEQVFQAFYRAHVDRGPESVASGPPSGCH